MSVIGQFQKLGLESNGADLLVTAGQFVVNGPGLEKVVVSNITTAGAVTYTAANLLGKFITRDPNGAARSDVTPTATLLLQAMKHKKIGTSFRFHIKNTADGAETITVTAGTGVTLSGTMTIDQNKTREFLVVVTALTTPAVTIYSLGDFTS